MWNKILWGCCDSDHQNENCKCDDLFINSIQFVQSIPNEIRWKWNGFRLLKYKIIYEYRMAVHLGYRSHFFFLIQIDSFVSYTYCWIIDDGVGGEYKCNVWKNWKMNCMTIQIRTAWITIAQLIRKVVPIETHLSLIVLNNKKNIPKLEWHEHNIRTVTITSIYFLSHCLFIWKIINN